MYLAFFKRQTGLMLKVTKVICIVQKFDYCSYRFKKQRMFKYTAF